MATYYFRNVNNAWGTASNWSLTSGGGATGAVPGNSDDVIFDSNSFGSCNLVTNRNCRTLSFTTWSGTFNMGSVFLRIYGSLDYGSGLFTITNPGSWEMGGTTGVMNGQTIQTNGKTISGTLSFGYSSGSTSVVLLGDVTCNQLQIQSNVGTAGVPLFTGFTMYVQANIITSSNGRNLFATTPIKMIGTGVIQTFNSAAALGCDIEIDTAGTITLNGTVFTTTNFKLKHTSGTLAPTGLLYIQAAAELDLASVSLNSVYVSNSPVITLTAPLVATSVLLIAGATFTTNSLTVGNLTLGTGTLILSAGIVNTITTSMRSLTATLAARALIRCATVGGAKAILNLQPGATQDNGYLSATDVDSSGGVTIWTYKGVLTREVNWNTLSTDPRKHVLKFNNRIPRY